MNAIMFIVRKFGVTMAQSAAFDQALIVFYLSSFLSLISEHQIGWTSS
jgi:hypothetical protein